VSDTTDLQRTVTPRAPLPPLTPRLVGLDIARGVALSGMLLAHYARSVTTADPGWLQAFDNAADGRAAPLFCV